MSEFPEILAALDPAPAPDRILIVDDDEAVRTYVKRCLERERYLCETAADGREALAKLTGETYTLLLCDITMPQVGGLEVLRRARERFGDDLAVVMATGINDKDTGIEALRLGASSYLIKPFEPTEVILHVANALERRRLTLEGQRFQSLLREEIRKAQEEIGWRLLAAVGWRDEETGAHIHRVGRGAQVIAERLGWSAHRASLIKMAAAMHDIGKIGLPDAILRKPGRLTEEEFEFVKRHTTMGADMLSGSANEMLRLAEEVARCHHERWDGAGYPAGLRGEDIPESARIVAVIDVYDALISERPYRPAYSEQAALEIMRKGRERHFDPRVLDTFFQLLPAIRQIDDLLRCAEDPSLRFPAARLQLRTQRTLALLPELERLVS